jgi:hypothetical protein
MRRISNIDYQNSQYFKAKNSTIKDKVIIISINLYEIFLFFFFLEKL